MTDKVFDQIMEIRKSGICNLFDIIAIQNEAYKKGFFELVVYLEEHKKEYVQFILYGKRPDQDQDLKKKVREEKTLIYTWVSIFDY